MAFRRAAKIDDNQPEIVEALRKVGASVQSLAAAGKGVPDLLVSFRGVNYLLEVKMEKGKLTDDQVKWHQMWQAPIYIVRSVEDALRAIGLGVE